MSPLALFLDFVPPLLFPAATSSCRNDTTYAKLHLMEIPPPQLTLSPMASLGHTRSSDFSANAHALTQDDSLMPPPPHTHSQDELADACLRAAFATTFLSLSSAASPSCRLTPNHQNQMAVGGSANLKRVIAVVGVGSNEGTGAVAASMHACNSDIKVPLTHRR